MNIQPRFEERFSLLQEAGNQLRAEFVGIDGVIEQVLQAAGSWFLFPEFQERPAIVNLWGLTGVGKTALIKRLGELLFIGDQQVYINLREANGNGNLIFDNLEALEKRHPNSPVMIVLDEFQAIRTRNELGEENRESTSGLVWPLLESGRIQIPYYDDWRYRNISELRYELPFQLASGVLVKNGRVVAGKDSFLKGGSDSEFLPVRLRRRKPDGSSGDVFFVQDARLNDLLFLAEGKFASVIEVREYLNQLDGPGTIDFLRNVLAGFACKGVYLNFSRALIFVLGNIEKIYSLAGDVNPDVDPDIAHRESLQIKVPVLKSCLEEMFRCEQIARLGNTHIVYPTFSRDSFRKIILLE